jgi:hypothetical protein
MMLGDDFKTVQYLGDRAAGTDAGESLSIVAGPSAFTYAVFDASMKELRELGHVTVQNPADNGLADVLPSLLDNFGLAGRRFTRVYAALQASRFVLLPEAFAGEAVKPYLEFGTGAYDIRSALTHHLDGLQLSFEPDPLTSTIERKFPNALLRHSGAVNISLLLSASALADSDIFLVLGDGRMELCAKRDGALLFYNVFDVRTAEDALYYLLFMMEQFRLDPAVAVLCVAGEIAATDPLMKDIRKYVKRVNPAVTKGLKRSGELLNLPEHYYFTLLNQHQCEL